MADNLCQAQQLRRVPAQDGQGNSARTITSNGRLTQPRHAATEQGWAGAPTGNGSQSPGGGFGTMWWAGTVRHLLEQSTPAFNVCA